MVTAAVGAAAGAALSQRLKPVPKRQSLGEQAGAAARQLGRLVDEVHAAREQARKVGRALS